MVCAVSFEIFLIVLATYFKSFAKFCETILTKLIEIRCNSFLKSENSVEILFFSLGMLLSIPQFLLASPAWLLSPPFYTIG